MISTRSAADARALRPLLASIAIACCAALLAAAIGCVTPKRIVRDGVEVPAERAAELDLSLARAHREAGRTEEAQRVLERSLRELARTRRFDRILDLLAEVRLEQGDREGAAVLWRRIPVEHPRSEIAVRAGYRAAELYRDLGRADEALRVLASLPWQRAEDELRAKVHRLNADLARSRGAYADAVEALALARRDETDPERSREIDLELEELLESRLRDVELARLPGRLPPGPALDRANLVIARRALERGDVDAARRALDRLPARLRPAEAAERARLYKRAQRGYVGVEQAVGLAVPLTGPFAPFGESVLRGVVLGLGLFEEGGSRYRVLVRDTGGEPEGGRTAVRELVAEGVTAILGPLRSSVAETAGAEAELAGVPLLTLARSEAVSSLGAYVFRLSPTAVDQVRALVRYAVDERGFARLAVLHPNDAYGGEFARVFTEEVEAHGARVVASEAYDPDATDFQPEIKRLVGLDRLSAQTRELLHERERLRRSPQRNPERLAELEVADLPPYVDFDALFVPDEAYRLGLLLPQIRFHDVTDVTLLGTSDWNDPALLVLAAREAASSVFVDGFHSGVREASVQSFVERYTRAYASTPELQSAEGYAAAQLLRSILDRSGAVSRAELRSRLLEVRDVPLLTGTVSIDETGGARTSLRLLTVRKGAVTSLFREP